MNDPSWTAQVDQAQASMRDLAKVTAAYYHCLIALDVPAESAAIMAGALGASVCNTTPRENA